jgi:hypothetical protein
VATEPKVRRYKGGVRVAILAAIRAANKGLTAPEIAEKLGINTNTVYINTRTLVAEGRIKRVPDRKHHRFFSRKASDEEMLAAVAHSRTVQPRSTVIEKFTVDIEPVDLYNFLVKWQKAWEPKIFESARNLPLGIARLFELACEQAFGSLVSEQDIIDVRVTIDQFRRDLEQTLRVTNGILDDARLWDRHRFAHMTIADKDIDKIRTIAFKVKQVN